MQNLQRSGRLLQNEYLIISRRAGGVGVFGNGWLLHLAPGRLSAEWKRMPAGLLSTQPVAVEGEPAWWGRGGAATVAV